MLTRVGHLHVSIVDLGLILLLIVLRVRRQVVSCASYACYEQVKQIKSGMLYWQQIIESIEIYHRSSTCLQKQRLEDLTAT